MRFYKGVSDAGQENFKAFPYASSLNAYAGVAQVGATPVIGAVTTDASNFLGVPNEPAPYSNELQWSGAPVIPGFDPGAATGTVALGTTSRVACHVHRPGDLYEADYAIGTGDDVDATGASTATTIVAAATDTDLEGGWVYIVRGLGAGQLRYIASSNGTTITLPAAGAFTTTPDATSRFIVIRKRFSVNNRLTAAGREVSGEAVSTMSNNGFKLREVWVEHPSLGKKELTPVGSSNIREPGLGSLLYDFDVTSANTIQPRFYAVLEPTDPF